MNITLFGSNKKPQYILQGLRSCNPCSYFISNRKKNSYLEIYGKKIFSIEFYGFLSTTKTKTKKSILKSWFKENFAKSNGKKVVI